MKKSFASKFLGKSAPIVLVVLLALVFFAASSGMAMAQSAGAAQTQTPSDYGCSTTSLATCFAYFTTFLVSNVLGVLIATAGWIIQIGIQLSSNVYNSPEIQIGFGVCLSIANLGFVLAIIVIAIATILRSETYGYKKTLWRLIVMAILVNFGLVITAPIINLANGMTTYFETSISGGVSGVTAFLNKVTGAVSPAAGDQPPTTNCSPTNSVTANALAGGVISQSDLNTICNATANSNPAPSTSFMQSLLSLIFTIVFKLIIAIAFFSIGALLFVRYIWLGVLLILLPLAWLMWIFPKFSHEFGRWWSNFIKWSFFPPAAMFFIWLALSIQSATANGGYLNTVGSTGLQGGGAIQTPPAALAAALGQSNLLNQFMNNLIVISIMIGGLMAAASLTGKAGNFVVEQAKGVSGAITGYVGKQSKKAARVAYQKAGGQKITSALQEGRFGLRYIPLVGRGASLAGRAISSVSSNEKLVEEAKKKVPKNPDEIRRNLRGSMNKEDQLAHIAKLVEMGELRERYKDKDGTIKDEMVNGKTMREFLNSDLAKDSGIAQRYGQVKMGGDADKAVGGDKAVRLAEDELEAARKRKASEAELMAATKKLDDAVGEFIEKMQKSDIAKINVNEIFQHDTALSQALLKQFALKAPQLVTGALPKMKAKNLITLDITYRNVIKQIFEAGDPETKERLVGVSQGGTMEEPWKDSVLGRYNRALGNNATGFSGAGGGGGPRENGGGGEDEH